MKQEAVYDVAVIGAGTMGMATGACLAGQGVNTLLIDAFDPPHHHGSHHGSTRMMRHAYGEGREYVALVKRAQQLWEELDQQSTAKIFEKTGVLGLGDKSSPFLKETIASAETHQLPLEVLTSQAVQQRWPGFSVPEHFIGCFEEDAGIIYSEAAILAYRELAVKHGAHLITNTPVTDIREQDEQTIKIETKDQVYFAHKVIVTAGAWVGKLLKELQLPLQPTRKAFGWFEAPAIYDVANFPAFYIEEGDRMCYGFPEQAGQGLKIGRAEVGQSIDPDQHKQNFGAYGSDEADLRFFLTRYLPEANGELKEGKTCLYTNSPDSHFIIDQHPTLNRVILAAGFSGHGFKFSSVMGEVLSQLALEGTSDFDLSLFSLARFNQA